MSTIQSGIGFGVGTNVRIQVIDSERNELIKTINKHNKCKRGLVTGILRFLQGQYNLTYGRDDKEKIYHIDGAKEFIPCHIGVGDGGIILGDDGKPTYQIPRIPYTEADWNDNVNYSTNRLIREIDTGSRCKISRITDSTNDESAGDIDSIFIDAALPPGFCNMYDGGVAKITPASITEVGLFASNICGDTSLLASVQLTNKYDEDGIIKGTDILYVRPQDTVLIRWTISIIALGSDSILDDNPVDSDLGAISFVEE